MDAESFARPRWSFPAGMDRPGDGAPSANATSNDAGRPADAPGRPKRSARDPASPAASDPAQGVREQEQQGQQPPRRRRRRYRPRTCRICLETVNPTTELDESSLPSFISGGPRVRYVSEDPELGRLISPCRCQGTQKYVHEGCLKAWRSARSSDRNLWQCPTCLYKYKFERLHVARLLARPGLRIALTASVLVVSVFLLGFIADPIINLYVDPYGTIFNPVLDFFGAGAGDEAEAILREFERRHPNGLGHDTGLDEPGTWSFHFLKGLFSFGLLGFVKSFLTLTPFQWFYFRPALNARRGGGGRDRMESVNLGLVLIGVFTFLAATWKVVTILSGRLLDVASDRILEVGADTDSDNEDNDAGGDAGEER